MIGSFAFTFSVPLILMGNGLGVFVLRHLTVGNLNRLKKYVYLENGAMYAIGCLAIVLLLRGFGLGIPEFVSPIITFIIIGYFFWKSKQRFTK